MRHYIGMEVDYSLSLAREDPPQAKVSVKGKNRDRVLVTLGTEINFEIGRTEISNPKLEISDGRV